MGLNVGGSGCTISNHDWISRRIEPTVVEPTANSCFTISSWNTASTCNDSFGILWYQLIPRCVSCAQATRKHLYIYVGIFNDSFWHGMCFVFQVVVCKETSFMRHNTYCNNVCMKWIVGKVLTVAKLPGFV